MTAVQPSDASAPTPIPTAQRPHRRRAILLRVAVFAVILAGLGFWGHTWMRTSMFFVTETDARIMTDLVVIGARRAGEIIDRPIAEGDRVAAGQVLVRLDDRADRLRLAELNSRLATVDAEIARIRSDRALAESRLAAALATRRAELREAEAARQAASYEEQFAATDEVRIAALAKTGNAPRSRLERARTTALTAAQNLRQAEAGVAAARAAVAQAAAEAGRRDVFDNEVAGQVAERREIMAAIARQRHAIERLVMRSPLAGVVDQTFVLVGEYVAAGQRLMAIHDPAQIRVEANLRETDVARVAVGQKVDIHVDAYPDDVFTGRVSHIGNAANSRFGLLPNLNQSGNFTKVTQRIETHIAIDHLDGRLMPGMMVEVKIHAAPKNLF
ncbi:MAG: HlyD family secretion protein [Thalassobaculaceae bacterium]